MLPFTGNPLNRASEKRPDAAWIEAARRDPATRILPLWQLQALTAGESPLRAALLPPDLADQITGAGAACVFLGLDGEAALFALDVSATGNVSEMLKPYGEFRELRAAAPFLHHHDLAILSQAKALIDWHARHGFCARCGASTVLADAGYKRVCTKCQTEHFPRTDPAVIMLATHGGHCLLGRNKNWPPEFYSALAGFVEPGESFEEAVRRELFEEAGVVAGKVSYVACQPWPFPSSLMIGCFAECESKSLKLDPNEIADAVWYDRKSALDLLDGKIEGRRGPFSVAIAHHLIRVWALP
jgi:NAD+ diphosphatase